jgi:beta-lactam-binding protein with PASTA domain
MPVPKLIGLTFEDAKAYMDAQGLSLGAVLTDPNVRDMANAYIYWQSPKPRTDDGAAVRIRPGQMIDIRLSVEKPVIDSTEQNNPVPLPPQQ